ncbi:RICIN domain-containing protein [Streptomyces sp. NPDC056831]|uniref:RICIN domain-containing protein n=1 Tax=Streptomyces sp. NPDC056831 TaxID=3345954 RepID=UPI00368C9E8C
MRTTIRRTMAVVATAVAATVAVGLGASAAQTRGASAAAPRPAVQAAVESGADIAQGGLYRVVSERYEVLDLSQSETADGTRIQTWEKNESPAQTWRFWDGGEGSYLVETTAPDGEDKVVDADVNDSTVNLWRMNGSNGEANQRWTFEPVGGGWFHVRNSAKGCLTAGAAEGDQVTIQDCGDDFAQLWCLESAEPPSGPATEKGIRGEAARAIEADPAPPVRALADEPAINTEFLIVDVAKAQAAGRSGVSVHWIGPTKRNPYNTSDWIDIRDESGSRMQWDWVCPQTASNCDGANGATFINVTTLQPGKKYTITYWSDGGKVSNGTLRASAEFVA